MSLLEPIDNYCERLSPELLAEPLNAVSNLAFFIAFFVLCIEYKKSKIHNRPVAAIIALVLKVGIGSALFHTFANKLTMIADVVPIMALVLTYLFFAQRYLLTFSTAKSFAGLAIILAASAATAFAPPELKFNGSINYFPCLAAILFLAWKTGKKLLYIASATFFCSLTFRSIDMAICEQFATGTHFLWHTLNGVVIYLLAKALINHCASARSV